MLITYCRASFAAIAVTMLSLTMFFCERVSAQAGEQRAYTLETLTTPTGQLNYLLFLPNGYKEKPEKKWPLILFLHGGGQWGKNLEDLERVRGPGQLPSIVEQFTDFPFFVVSPQFPRETTWPIDSINALLDERVLRFTIDTNRIYLTGVSMGGYYTWYFAIDHPERLAAIVPIGSVAAPEFATNLKEIPAWIFHGAKDMITPPEESELMFDALKTAGGNVRLTLYPDAGHDAWTLTYKTPELYTWLLKQVRGQKRAPEPMDGPYHQGITHVRQEAMDKAVVAFKKAIEINPDDATAHSGLGFVYYTQGLLDKAITAYRKVVEINPDYGGAYYHLACAYSLKSKKTSAIESLQKAIRSDDNWIEYCQTDSAFENIRNSPEWKQFINPQ